MSKINYQLIQRNSKPTLPESLGFGVYFTDHMFEMDYDTENGWHNYNIKPVENIPMHPATMFIHYGQAIFEGLKAFKQNDDIVIFRPEMHFKRLNNSARRLCMPEVDIDFVIESLKELIAIEKDWIPSKKGESLYIRPVMVGIDKLLGVHPSKKFKFYIILSPVGAYYPEGFKPVKILVQDKYVRAVRKGLGDCKTPANYAASLLATEEANREGYTQVLWLDGVELKYIEEVGTMNIFIVFKDEVVTPALTGSILPGVTRDTVLHLLKEWSINHSERLVSIDELIQKYDKGELLGVFGTGTAAIISSVSEIKYKDRKLIINKGEPDDLAVRLFNEITGIHYGLVPDKHNWLTPINIQINVE